MSLPVRVLQAADADSYRTIRLAALATEPQSFGSLHAIEAGRPIEHHVERLRSSRVFAAFDQERIVGLAGLKPNDGPKEKHKAVIWGFYVEPAWRGRGVGSALISALLHAASDMVEQVTLTVVTENGAAIALYERFGFVRYGLEPRSLKSACGYQDEALMVRFLDKPPPPGKTA